MIREELIGKTITIPNKKITGKIINETRNTITILTKEKIKKIVDKGNNKFNFCCDNKIIELDGRLFIGRPEDRIKKRMVKV